MFNNPIWWIIAIVLIGLFDWLIYKKIPDFVEIIKEGIRAKKIDKTFPKRFMKQATKDEVRNLEKELGHKVNEDVYIVVDEESKK